MRKVFSIALLMMAATLIVACNMPKTVTQAFAKQYPGIKPKWEKEGANFEAGFNQNGIATSALYDTAGNLLETETVVDAATLPPAVFDYTEKTYKGPDIKSVSKIVDAKGVVTYEVGMKGKSAIFDADGKFIREEK